MTVATPSAAVVDPAAPPKSASRYGYFVAAALCGVYTLNFLDRQFLSVLIKPVREELGLNRTQIGALTGLMFALFYTFCGIPIAALADRWKRTRIIAVACALWSFFTAACGFATSFATLAVARIGVGVGEAGGSPPSYSLLSDYFPPSRRGLALAIYSLGVPLGSMFGIMLGGFIAAQYGWRAAFKALGVVGLLVAPLVLVAIREPKRGAFDERPDATVAAHEPAPGMFSAIGFFIRSPSLMLTAVSAGLTAFCGYGILVWDKDFLGTDKGMSLTQIAGIYSLVSGLSMAAGTFLSGWLVDRLGKRDPAAYALVPGVCILLSAPFLWGAVYAPSWPVAVAFLAGPALLNNAYLAPALAVVQNGVPAQNRGTSGALLLFMLNLIGLGGGPLFVGMVSDALKPQYGVHALAQALLWLTPFFVLAFLCQLAAAYMLRRRARAA